VAEAAAVGPGSGRRPIAPVDPGVVHRESGHLRGAARVPRTCERLARPVANTGSRASCEIIGYAPSTAIGPRRWSVGKPVVLIPREFTVTRRNKAWVTDITYIRTWQGWLCLVVVMDLFSRKIVGWAAGPTIHRELVLDAVLMAVHRRRPRGTLSLRSGRPVRLRCVAALLPLPSARAEHEPKGQLLGQRRR
jgi:transposase InsO family protein